MEQQDTIKVKWSGGTRLLHKANCATCGKDRGYKKPSKIVGDCKSCTHLKRCNTFDIEKKCNKCGTTEVKNPSKDWFAGPTCSSCYGKEYRQKNKEKIRESINRWRQNNSLHHKDSENKWRKRNANRRKITDSKWRAENADHVRERQLQYQNKREKEDPNFKIARRLRHRIYQALKEQEVSASEKLRDMTGVTIEELKKHLESQFTGGMSWDNWTNTGWHIDHIVPLCSFDLSDPEQRKESCALSNLRPLWHTDNRSKSFEDRKKSKNVKR